MRVLVERVTCETCGLLCEFERARRDLHFTVRLETLGEWLRNHGWTEGPIDPRYMRTTDHCPACSKKK